MTTILTSERLILRPWRDDDLDALAQLCADPEVMAHFPAVLDRTGSAELLGRLMAHQVEHGFTFWALERCADGVVIGFSGLARVGFAAPFVPAVEIGWRLARPFWGQGYALEAARRSLRFAFEELGLEQVVAFTVQANRRSWGLMERLGMHRDPTADFEHPNLPSGHPLRPHWLYRLKREDWYGR
ncbi:GNAT family N-acetyltransferase [Pseudomonas sp. 8AS]|uniref:GNAT family N-acetyltransferase n=1 Tax=Pseudomonas sp. 8AS TaxID=2653163 RepID=UPI00135C507E|nr:GNAT family N-acetyltransferase [Pseudomonas sp. 8AS]